MRFYGELVRDARQAGQIAGVIDLAGERGDVPGLIALSERYARLQTGRSTSNYITGSYRFMPTIAIARG